MSLSIRPVLALRDSHKSLSAGIGIGTRAGIRRFVTENLCFAERHTFVVALDNEADVSSGNRLIAHKFIDHVLSGKSSRRHCGAQTRGIEAVDGIEHQRTHHDLHVTVPRDGVMRPALDGHFADSILLLQIDVNKGIRGTVGHNARAIAAALDEAESIGDAIGSAFRLTLQWSQRIVTRRLSRCQVRVEGTESNIAV